MIHIVTGHADRYQKLEAGSPSVWAAWANTIKNMAIKRKLSMPEFLSVSERDSCFLSVIEAP